MSDYTAYIGIDFLQRWILCKNEVNHILKVDYSILGNDIVIDQIEIKESKIHFENVPEWLLELVKEDYQIKK